MKNFYALGEFKDAVSQYVSGEFDIWDMVDASIHLNTLIKSDEIDEVIDYLEKLPSDNDKTMLFVALYFALPNSVLFLRDNYENEFINFLTSLRDDYDLLPNEKITWYEHMNDELVFKRGNLYFFFNSSLNDNELVVPNELLNSECFCLNCNTTEKIETRLAVPSLSFYILEKN